MAQRKALSKKLRFQILERDNFACRYCGRGAPEYRLEIDHVTPVACGGSDHPDNLIAACCDCNAGKSWGLLNTCAADRPGLRPLPSQAVRYLDFASRVGALRWEDASGDPGSLYHTMVAWHRYGRVPAEALVDIAMTAPTYLSAYPAMGRYRRDHGIELPRRDDAPARFDA